MYIDDCRHTFQQLTSTILPGYLKQLNQQLADPHQLTEFMPGRKPIQKYGRPKDFSGCYVLIDNGTPIYVGIARGVIKRLRQHITGKSDNTASLVYRMAKQRHPHPWKRAEAMKKPAFLAAFKTAQGELQCMNVAFVEIDCPVELHLFEVLAAMELKTHQWNTFKTH